MSRNIFLHAGPHKTGSTLLQNSLKEAAPVLEAASVRYVPVNKLTPYLRFKSYVKTEPAEALAEDFTAFLTDEALVNDAHIENFIVSYEGFPGNLGKNTRLYPNSAIFARQLKNACESKGLVPHLVFYIRRQDTFMESLALQQMHSGRAITVEDFLRKQTAMNDIRWMDMLQEYVEIFGREKVHVLAFESIKKGPAAYIETFMNLVDPGLQIPIPVSRRSNLSFSQIAYEFAREAYKYIPEPADRKKLSTYLQTNFSNRAYPLFTHFSDDDREEIISRYEQENQAIFEVFDLPQDIYLDNYRAGVRG